MKLLAFTLASLASQAHAWFGKGHLLTARVAYDLLDEDSPDTIEKVEKILDVLKKTGPDWVGKEGDHPMVECATFADDIKGKGGRFQSSWHFVDLPYLDQGGTLKDFDFKFAAHNITEAIGGIVGWFNKVPGYNETYIYDEVLSHLITGQSE